ncbi:MAG: DUF423 domain-containing protein [Candidatus Heimdallarchaeota archaeon]|nr:DUF423 domain-containing protein [Candidatus Heimdallarchaeota archaeon]
MNRNSNWLFWGAFIAGLSVAMGAFGAHALESRLTVDELSTYETAVRYQMYHALALLLLSTFSNKMSEKESKIIGWSFLLGVILFSGSLYILLLTDISILGAITPIGGVSFLTGWFYLARFAFKVQGDSKKESIIES